MLPSRDIGDQRKYRKYGKKTNKFQNPAKPTCIDLIITNKPGMFQNAKTYETGLSDFHKLVVNTMKLVTKKDRQA